MGAGQAARHRDAIYASHVRWAQRHAAPSLTALDPLDVDPSGAIQGFIWLALRNDSRDPSPRA